MISGRFWVEKQTDDEFNEKEKNVDDEKEGDSSGTRHAHGGTGCPQRREDGSIAGPSLHALCHPTSFVSTHRQNCALLSHPYPSPLSLFLHRLQTLCHQNLCRTSELGYGAQTCKGRSRKAGYLVLIGNHFDDFAHSVD